MVETASRNLATEAGDLIDLLAGLVERPSADAMSREVLENLLKACEVETTAAHSFDIQIEVDELIKRLTDLQNELTDFTARDALETLLEACRPTVAAFYLGTRFDIPSSSEVSELQCMDRSKGHHDLAWRFRECAASSEHVYCKRHGDPKCPKCGAQWR